MENASYIALSHQMTLRRQMDVIANNVANSSTPAFKVDRTIFVEELVTTPDGQEMTFVQDVGLARDTTGHPRRGVPRRRYTFWRTLHP
jgi:flagellar basal-body rod protein FlgF